MEENPSPRKRIHEKLDRLNTDLQNAKSRKASRLPLKAQDMQRDLAQAVKLIDEAFDDWEGRIAALKPGLGERLRSLFGAIRSQDRSNGTPAHDYQFHKQFHKFRCVDCAELFSAYDPESSELLKCPKCGSKDIHIIGLTHPCRAESPIHIHDCKEVAELHQAHDDAVLKCYELDTTIDELRSQNSELQRFNREFNDLFTLQNKKIAEATNLWRVASGKTDVLPDLGVLLTWLIDELVKPKLEASKPLSFDNPNDVAPTLATSERPSEEATAQKFLTQIQEGRLEANKGCYEDGAEARIVHQAKLTDCPPVSTYGAFAAASWRAGWLDADREMNQHFVTDSLDDAETTKLSSHTDAVGATWTHNPATPSTMLTVPTPTKCISCIKVIDEADMASTPAGKPIHKKCLEAVRKSIESFGENPDEIMGTDILGAELVADPALPVVPPRKQIRVVKIPPPPRTKEGKL